MKKNKLIEILNAIEGNPDIVLWNGMVGDWMDINTKLVPGYLVKQTLSYYREMYRLQRCSEEQNWDYTLTESEEQHILENYKGFDWEENSFVYEDDIKEKRYKKKNILYIDAKPRGIKTFDRCGNICY